ncbi:MAG: hypothetical protein BWY71_01567 [Planctomycetes bacterium ADurb.Bin412]|nr:MAG: hypothetical protein BWY71_01567 [Planctomycetes bacterium ADurb.Bin412]
MAFADGLGPFGRFEAAAQEMGDFEVTHIAFVIGIPLQPEIIGGDAGLVIADRQYLRLQLRMVLALLEAEIFAVLQNPQLFQRVPVRLIGGDSADGFALQPQQDQKAGYLPG